MNEGPGATFPEGFSEGEVLCGGGAGHGLWSAPRRCVFLPDTRFFQHAMVIDSRNSSILPRRGALLKVNQVRLPYLRATCWPRDPGRDTGPPGTHTFYLECLPLIILDYSNYSRLFWSGLQGCRSRVRVLALEWLHVVQWSAPAEQRREKVLASGMGPLTRWGGKFRVG